MSTALEFAIGRQLAAIDRRPLGLVEIPFGEPGYDGGFCERIINEAIDATLIEERYKVLWKGRNDAE